MLSVINGLPEHVFAVKATGEVSEEDLKNTLLPGLEDLSKRTGQIYYLLLLETPVGNFTAGAWWQDMVAGLKHFTQWKKMAIVTDQHAVIKFTDLFSYVAPGESKGYLIAELQDAIDWVSVRK